ncbi:MAG TPA: transglycosylase domain-containing protein, partial [Gemmatimonadales bacterium]|nr:transglycosylase domain-containing protein [Gemmatimonadales bacterium]
VPVILRHAILSAEDKNFFSHSGVDYGVLPRVARKTAARSLATWRNGDEGFRLRFPQGGSTLTQQLVRGFFLADRTRREDDVTPFRKGFVPRLLSAAVGVPTANKLLRKLEEARLALWVEREMRRRYGSREAAKREIFRRYASFIYLGNGRYGFAAASDYYFGRPLASYTPEDAGQAALLAGIGKSPRDYAPVAGDPRPLRRRNEILALMARNGYLSEDLVRRSRAEPIRVAPTTPVKTRAPAVIQSVFAELRRHGGSRFGIDDLFRGRVSVRSTVDGRIQTIVNEALESGLARYEERHPAAKGWVQGSVVVLRNSDAAILAEAGGRQVYRDRSNLYSDFNRATGAMRQAGSAWKPFVYLAAFRQGIDLDSTVPDEPTEVPAAASGMKWIANYDHHFRGPIPVRQALAESRNTVAVWLTREVGLEWVIRTARDLGIRSPLHPYISTALGASEVRLLELAGAYRAMASGILAEPHVIDRVTGASGEELYRPAPPAGRFDIGGLRQIQEGLRGVIRIRGGTANVLDHSDFPIPVMGKTGTTNGFRDALFLGSTYGPLGITVAVRIGFDDNRTLGMNETGGRTALPIFREIMLRVYRDRLAGPVPQFPWGIEERIDGYLAATAASALAAPGLTAPFPD